MRTHTRRTFCLIIWSHCLWLASNAGLVKAQEPRTPERPVLCWYMVCFGNSVEGYKQEIELAQRHGIDGFLLDVGDWQIGDTPDGDAVKYVQAADRLYEAARQLNSGFLLAMTPEYSAQPFTDKVHDMVMRYHDHPNQMKYKGKVVLSGYCSADMFPPVVEKLKADGVSVFLIPHLFLPRFIYNPSPESYSRPFETTPVLDGLMMFNTDQLGNNISNNAHARRATQRLNKLLAAGVIPAYNSANLQDYRGLSGYLAMWEGAINDGADWISIVIWNDYNEDSGLMPGRWPFGSERYVYNRDESFLNATSYASAWFKSGRRPTITQDKIFITHRVRSKWQRQGWDGRKWVDISLEAARNDQIHDDVADAVYLDTFLTAEAVVRIGIGPHEYRYELPAGVGHVQVPMSPGVPHVRLERDGQVLVDVLARKQIIDKPTERNSLVGYHAVNRTWTSGVAVGPVVKRLEAEGGTIEHGASIVKQGPITAVKNQQVKGSGFTVAVDGLKTGTYNIRIRYANASDQEARLTLFADGPARASGDYPYFIPAYLPPTDRGQFQTVSFFWSLYDSTSHLKLQWQPGVMWGKPDPVDDDFGEVMIDAIELVKVEPVEMPQAVESLLPELVPIPGGRFMMGHANGEPDELPRRQVTVSDFAMGKYEVTNEEYERFDPSHRQVRNGNSWRNREPVLHVSWVDAARYCNWLSQQAGLKPVYREQVIDLQKSGEKHWVADFSADGFRLPTEAEWEYVADGRGENRTYPWGDQTPRPGVHGRFEGDAALGPRLPRPATEGGGVVVVGSYPAGASRDGVMDMAGNVAEWCTDWYAPYPAEAQTDPCQTKPGKFRVIRGGSWGWYSHSQRSSDREFNSQNYPGHAYYGFRVVLGQSGWQKLRSEK